MADNGELGGFALGPADAQKHADMWAHIELRPEKKQQLYQVVRQKIDPRAIEESFDQFAAKVSDLIRDGWVLLGAPSVHELKDHIVLGGLFIIQTMKRPPSGFV